jgi:anti-sigma regulatory factor (Ser/Thr protein kinase)
LSHSVAAYSTTGVCAICEAELPDDAKVGALPEPSFDVIRSMPADPSAPAQARRAVATLPLAGAARKEVPLVVSELVTNAVRHAGLAEDDAIELGLRSDNRQVLVTVKDGGPGFDPPAPANGKPAARGLGLSLVEALADAWGVERSPNGCTVWCALSVERVAMPGPLAP